MLRNSKVERLLADVFDAAREALRKTLASQEYQKRKDEFVFHMTDWLGDLQRLTTLVDHPERFDEESASLLVVGFLYHVIPHLNAAGTLLLDEVANPFAPAANAETIQGLGGSDRGHRTRSKARKTGGKTGDAVV